MQKQTSFFDGPDLPSVSLFSPLLSESLRSLFRCIRRQISRYHCPSDAAIRLSLRLNLKCPPASAHLPVNMHMFDCGVTDEGRNWTENSFLLQERRAACRGQGGSANHALGMETSSDARRHTSEMNNKAERLSEGALAGSGWFSLGRAGAETGVNILRNGSKRMLGWPPPERVSCVGSVRGCGSRGRDVCGGVCGGKLPGKAERFLCLRLQHRGASGKRSPRHP